MRSLQITYRTLAILLATVALLPSCSHDHENGHGHDDEHGGEHQEGASGKSHSKTTNRLTVPPRVVKNLGITFTKAIRGKVGSWISVPGELYVPDTHRWNLRAPAEGRIVKIAPKWKKVIAREVIAEILSPELRHAQQDLLAAVTRSESLKQEVTAAEARLHSCSVNSRFISDLQKDTFKRLNDLRKLNQDTNAFGARELLSAQREFTEASMAVLNAGLQKDKLSETVREKKLLGKQAQLKIDEAFESLSLISGRTFEELRTAGFGGEVWKTISSIEIRAPAAGIIVEVFASRGEKLDKNQPLALILDPVELRLRGWLPEGDLSLLKENTTVRIELPGELPPITTTLLGPRPLADSKTRRVQVEAKVPNPDRKLPQGLSATAQVLVKESAREEVLLPPGCIVNDGLEKIVFRRDPENPEVVIRTPVELGLRGGGQVEIISGVLAGDSVVEKGIHQLKQSGLGKAPKGGHFHADGTWHLEDE